MSNQELARTEEVGTPQVEDSNDKVKTKLSDTQKEALVNFVEYLVDTLTFKRVFLIALLGIMGIGLFSLFENRRPIMNHILSAPMVSRTVEDDTKAWELSPRSKGSLVALTQAFPVKYVDVTEVDLKRNSRNVRFAHMSEPSPLGVDVKKFMTEIYKPHAVFDYDTRNTAQMVAVLANEFRCDNYADTMYFKIAPEVAGSIATVCHIAIPPFVGQFVGYLTIGLERKMSKVELDTVRLELSRIAVEIYLQDVTKQPPT